MEDRGSKSRSVRSKNWRQRHVGPMRWVFAVMIGTMALAGCGGEQDAAEATPTREAIKATNVAAMKVQPDSLTQVSRYPASVEAWRDVQVSFLESGPVSRILVDLGDRVQKGQLLATLHTSLLDAALIEAEA